jgi:hypothetical protein
MSNDESGDNCFDRANNIGFHGRDVLSEIPDSVRRVAFFGDSFVEAGQVVSDSIFFNVYEDLQNVHGWKTDALGFGMTGNGADQELFRSIHVMQQFRINDVVYVFFFNDFLDGYDRVYKPTSWPFLEVSPTMPIHFTGHYQYESSKSIVGATLSQLMNRSYLLSFLSYRNSLLKPKYDVKAVFGPDSLNIALFSGADSLPQLQAAARRHWEDVMKYWRDLCALNNIGLHVLYMHGKWEIDDSVYSASLNVDVPQRGISQWVESFCKKNNIDFLNPSEYLASATGRKGRELYWAHLNNRGHRLLGHYLHESLR